LAGFPTISWRIGPTLRDRPPDPRNVVQATRFSWISANFFTARLPSAGYSGAMGWANGHIGPIFVGQAAIAGLAMGAIAFTPPAQGRILVAPLNGQPVDQQLIRQANATPLVPGPLPGSWIVEGQRAQLARSFSSKGIIFLAAPQAVCADREQGVGTS